MNVYDFDGTIYDGDSTMDFYLYCLRRHPKVIKCMLMQIKTIIAYCEKHITKTQCKERLYIFLKYLPDIDKDIEHFWNINQRKIKKWYLDRKKDDDIIISASPEFLLSFICERLNVRYVIASRVDKKTGKYSGYNCYGIEKVYRFQNLFDGEIEEFYSDSDSDRPLANIAKKAYIVKRNKIEEWKYYE